MKCEKKGLKCPGYGPHWRWAGGVASRGRLRGQRIPVEHEEVEEVVPMCKELAPPDTSQSTTLQMPSLKHFIDYYEKNIAGLMVWVDSASNDYRRYVIPRATEVPGLRFALAAFASHHGSTALQAKTDFHESARDAALEAVQKHLQEMNGKLTSGAELNSHSDLADAEWMLAAIMIIASCETAKSQANLAESHRMAARRLLNIFWPRVKSVSPLFSFLRNQFAIDDVFASTTTFDLEQLRGTILPVGDGMFSEYLRVIYAVTLMSREGGSMSAKDVRLRFSQAREATLFAAMNLGIADEAKRGTIRLVDAYDHTGLCFGYRCMGHANVQNWDWVASVEKLFEDFQLMDDADVYIQNLHWPVFVAGTESYGNEERQQVVRAWLGKIIRDTGFKHHEDTMNFLEMFWQGTNEDWRPLAQDLQTKGFRVLPV